MGGVKLMPRCMGVEVLGDGGELRGRMVDVRTCPRARGNVLQL